MRPDFVCAPSSGVRERLLRVSPTIFNVMVDAVVREWLRQTLGNEAMTSGIGEEIRSFLAAFYADDGILQ